MVFLAERAKLVTEGGGAAAVAALLSGEIEPAASGATVAILSGGNVDPRMLAAAINRHEIRAGRRIGSRPGSTTTRVDWPGCSTGSRRSAATCSRSPTSATGRSST